VLLSATLYLVFISPRVQTFIVQKLIILIEKKIERNVSIQSVDINIKGDIILEGIAISDSVENILKIKELSVDVDMMRSSYSESYVSVKRLVLEELETNVVINEDGSSNISEIFSKFKSSGNDDSTSWDFDVKSISSINSSISYHNKYNQAPKVIFDYNNLDLDSVNFILSDLNFENNAVFFNIEALSLFEKKGLEISNTNAQVFISDTNIYMNNLSLAIGNSKLEAFLVDFKFEQFSDFKDFIGKVYLETNIERAHCTLNDLAYIFPKLKYNYNSFLLSGQFKGFVSDFKAKSIAVRYGKHTFLEGECNITGLPKLNETFMFVDLKKLKTSAEDIQKIQVFPFRSQKKIKLNKKFENLGVVNYSGNLTGFFSDIVAYGKLSTDAGDVDSDILVKSDSTNSNFDITGTLKLDEFNVSLLLDNKMLGNASFNLKVNSKIRKRFTEAELEGKVHSIDINNYTYKDISLKGIVSPEKFNGFVTVNDKNLKLDFIGNVNFNDTLPVYDFNLDVKYADLYRLKLFKYDTVNVLTGKVVSNFYGKSFDDFYGTVEIKKLSYKNSRKELFQQKSMLVFDKNERERSIDFQSDHAIISVHGNFSTETIVQSAKGVVELASPTFANYIETNSGGTDEFTFSLNINNASTIASAFYPTISISDSVDLHGSFSGKQKELNVSFSTDSLMYGENKFENIELLAKTESYVFDIRLSAVKELKEEHFKIETNTKLMNDSLKLVFDLTDEADLNNRKHFVALGQIFKKDSMTTLSLDFAPSRFEISDSLWRLNSASFEIASNNIIVNDFDVERNSQAIKINGKVSDNSKDSLIVDLERIDLKLINKFINNDKFVFNGSASGYVYLSNMLKNLVVVSDMRVTNLKLNDDLIGNVSVNSEWDNVYKRVHLNVMNKRGRLKNIEVDGFYYPKSKMLDFSTKLNNLDLKPLRSVFSESLSTFKGKASGIVNVNGTLKKPLLNGKVELFNMKFVIDYLKTTYDFSGVFDIRNSKAQIKSMNVIDEKSNYATAFGEFNIVNFANFNYDIILDCKDFMVINTTRKDNETFYGNVFFTGLVKLNGDKVDSEIDIEGSTAPNTRIFIPYSDSKTIVENNFVRFKSADIEEKDTVKENETIKGLQLSINLKATPDAKVQIILDESKGDVIEAEGTGNLRMVLNKYGDFSMYGSYLIEKGDYLFTFSDIINKKLDIQSGSNISWTGNPIDADIELDAVYRLKTTLNQLDLEIGDPEPSNKRVPAECYLTMSGKLMSPELSFRIELPNADDKYKEYLESMPEDVRTNQFFYLLVLNSFYFDSKMSSNDQSQNAIGRKTSMEVLSNQISHWVSKNVDFLDFIVNYELGDQLTNDEVQLALSTQLLNDRVTINVNGHTDVGREIEPTVPIDIPTGGEPGVGGEDDETGGSNAGLAEYIGDVSIEIKITKNGKFKVKGFSRQEDDMLMQGQHTQGVGIFYREDFNTLKDIFRREEEITGPQRRSVKDSLK